ncbi:ATP-binding protein [Comamonas endophytica]|uniref:ATP-binding protein n=1 Tax=Comamonas endophytica TaxID=2949090 RepID=A0ABY6GCZ2_9BURK|nr:MULTISPECIES: ATP-binding protein [unclassified Acidovorax]MCD2512864.1 ATP-binding protein [Acidovorax sp. D4N7]UYG52788.1 ATP-binding protein [Acidovorax sp. 5MLIR]
MNKPVPLRCDLHGSVQELPAFFERLEAWAREGGLPADLVAKIQLMLDEWLSNVALHAYGGAGGPVSVQVEFVPPCTLACVVRDHGPAFDPTDMPAPDLEAGLEERKIGGLGLHFVRQLADAFSYRRDGACNEITLSYSGACKRRI